jgi:hypothetical protein
MESKALLILGMHRSGTSALTRVCNLLGADLGDRLMPAAADNERGFWEQEDVVVLHEALLRNILAAWNDVFPLPHDWLTNPHIAIFQKKLSELLGELFSSSALWAIKDPRLSITLPAWLPVLEKHTASPVAVLALRHPLEVANSLLKRDRIPLSEGFAIWLHYTLMAEKHSRNMKRVVISYPDLLENPEHTCSVISTRLGFVWPHAFETKQSEIASFLTPELRHHAAPQDAELPPMVASIYSALLQSSKTGIIDTDFFDRTIAQWSEKPIFFLAPALRNVRMMGIEKDRTIDGLTNTRAQIEQTYRDLETKYVSLEKTYRDLEVTYQKLETNYGLQVAEKEKIATVLAETRAVITHKDNELQHLRSSNSWKITAPLRWVVGRLKKIV